MYEVVPTLPKVISYAIPVSSLALPLATSVLLHVGCVQYFDKSVAACYTVYDV